MDDPFAAFDLPHSFDLDRTALERAFLARSATLHPDRFPDPIEQAEALDAAARLNQARAILLNDERRADALLLLLGGPKREAEKSLPDGFLMEIMDVRQEMEEAVASNDPEQRRRFEQWAADRRGEIIDCLRPMFERAGREPSVDLLRDIRIELNAWRYIERMIEQLDPSHEPFM